MNLKKNVASVRIGSDYNQAQIIYMHIVDLSLSMSRERICEFSKFKIKKC